MKNTLSIAIATFNEEHNLERCFRSVNFADEIIVVDGGSTDDTVAIAKKYCKKIIITSNPPIFHINKQKALDACTSEWILQLDADEEVTEALKEEIGAIVRAEKPLYAGYFIQRKNYLLGQWMKWGGMYPDCVIRLVKKGKGTFPCKSVHEQITVDGEVGTLTNDLIHRSYPTFAEYLRKANTYTSLTAQEYRNQNVAISVSSFCRYMIWRPMRTFCRLFIHNRGFMDGFPGFVWALFSGLHHAIAYIKYWEEKQ